MYHLLNRWIVMVSSATYLRFLDLRKFLENFVNLQSVKIGRTNVSKFLNIYREAIVQSENSYVVWTALDNGIKQLGMVMDCLGDEGRLKARFNEFIRLLLERIVKSLPGEGWEQPNTNGSFKIF